MLKKFVCFLSSGKMTFVSFIFLAIGGLALAFNYELPVKLECLTIIISGIPIFYKGMRALFFSKKMTASLLITIAMAAAVLTDEIFAAAEVAFIMALGEILEDLTIDRAKRGLTKLLNLIPKKARKLNITPDNAEEIFVPAQEVHKDDIIRVLAGEDIPSDGIIIAGETSVNEAIMTGEAAPVDKTVGNTVYSGTTNCFGVIDIKVTKEYENSSIQKLVNLVKEAEIKKAPTQRIVDKWASVIIPLAVLFAIVVYFITGEISRAVTILVVFCPCSLVLATPTSIMAAIGHASKNGVIVKTGEALETIGKCDTFAFDKTGTLTTGKLSVSDIETFLDISKENILYYAASAELKSEHPIGRAIVEHALENNYKLNETSDFKMSVGRGVYAKLDNKKIHVGNEKFMENNDIELSGEIKKKINSKRLDGKVVLVVAIDKIAQGYIALSDTLRNTTGELLKKLQNSNTILLTGDNSLTAQYFSNKTGIKNYFSGLSPKDKVNKIEAMQKEGKIVCMTGDGINDAAALRTANAGVSMGTFGSDIAIESSDIIITGDDLTKLAYVKNLSFECTKTIKTNIIISMAINIASLTLSAMGILIPITGAIVHNIASVVVVANAALLYDKKII